MTPEQAFKSGGRNPGLGIWVRDWYAVTCFFSPRPVLVGEELIHGFRTLASLDVASRYLMETTTFGEPPAAVSTTQIVELLKKTFASHGVCRVGIVVSHSAWLSSTELELDEDTAVQGEFLSKNNIEFGPMTFETKREIQDWVAARGLACEFNGDNVANRPGSD